MAIKFVSPENLEYFKGKQDEQNIDTFAQKGSVPTKVSELNNDSGYQTASGVQQIVSSSMAAALTWKGTKPTTAELPGSGNKTGDVWHVTANDSEWAWNGSEWEELGSIVSVQWSGIQGKPSTFPPSSHVHTMSQVTDLPAWTKTPSKPTYTYTEVGAASASHSHTAFMGASASAAGKAGFVPAPPSGGEGKVLMGNGTWGDLPEAEAMTAMTTTEIDGLFQ